MVIWTWDLAISKPDCDRAKKQQVILLDENDLEYYEKLVDHLGPAAKYQFYSYLLPRNRKVSGLERDFPALSIDVILDTVPLDLSLAGRI